MRVSPLTMRKRRSGATLETVGKELAHGIGRTRHVDARQPGPRQQEDAGGRDERRREQQQRPGDADHARPMPRDGVAGEHDDREARQHEMRRDPADRLALARGRRDRHRDEAGQSAK